MPKVDGYQIDKLLAGYVRTSNLSANGSSIDITSELQSTLSTAGFNNESLTFEKSSGSTEHGIVVDSSNRVEVYNNSTKEKIENQGNEVYGRLTESSGTYTLTFYHLDNGSEVPYNFSASQLIDIEFGYRFEFGELPTDAFFGTTERNVVQDGGSASGGGRVITEQLTVSSQNTISDLSYTPNVTTNVTLFVRGKSENYVGSTPPFTVSGKQISWNSNNAGYNVDSTYSVVAHYTTLE